MEGYGLSSLGPTVGLSGLPDPMGDATAALEARRRQQATAAGYPSAAADATNPFEGILSALGPTINERAVAAREAMRRGDMATANALNQSLALDFGQFLGSIKPIRAYHGSPHDFDRFDISKIGTGEGAQAYGHGLYFAENEGVARSYRDAGPAARANYDAVNNRLGKIANEMDKIQSGYRKPRVGFEAQYQSLVDEYDALMAQRQKLGRMYEVDIHADPSRFLDWDAPLSGQRFAQTKPLDSLLEKAPLRPNSGASNGPYTVEELTEYGVTGRDLYDRLSWAGGKAGAFPEINVSRPSAASSALRDAGIPGIKYLDAGSRSAGAGTRNYVVFDDKLIEILRKYGIMAPVAGAGLSALPLGDEEGM